MDRPASSNPSAANPKTACPTKRRRDEINGASQVYFDAFRNSQRAQHSKVFTAFSIQCSGGERRELVAFAHRTFGMLLAICGKWLKKHGIKA